MKKKIRALLDWKCGPLWLYDEKGFFIANDNETILNLYEYPNLIKDLNYIQERHDSLAFDNKFEFRYVGFETTEEADKFYLFILRTWETVKKVLGDEYEFQLDIERADILP